MYPINNKKTNAKRLHFILLGALSILITGFLSVYIFSQQPVQYILKIDKTKKNTDALLQRKAVKIIHEQATCYLGIANEQGIAELNSHGVSSHILDQTENPDDRYYMVYLRDLNNLNTLKQNGIAVQVEGHHVLFRPFDSQNPRTTFPGFFRGIKRLGDSILIGQRPFTPEQISSAAKRLQVNSTISQMVSTVSQSNIRSNIQTLQDFDTRDATSSECAQAGEFLYNKFAQAGLQVSYDTFSFEGNTSRNVIGYLAGKTNPTSTIIICAHYDSTSEDDSDDAPGADDNASGVAAVLEAAKILSKYSFSNSIKFVLFSAEEYGLYGSAHYAKDAQNSGEHITAAINLDMIAYRATASQDVDVIVNSNSSWMKSTMEGAVENYTSIPVHTTTDGSYDYSDHYSFWERGFPALLLIEDYDDINPYYHSGQDTIDTIDLSYATEVIKASLAATAQLAEPVTNNAVINLNRTQLYFSGTNSGVHTGSQDVWINNSGGGSLNWSATSNRSWLTLTPASGTNNGVITVSVNPTSLAAGTYTGTISLTSGSATNSPQSISVSLTVKSASQTSAPFGDFSTPANGATVQSSFPVTGWALDDIGVQSVKIYREQGSSLVYIGDAAFIEGARPDVQTAYPNYPQNFKAGWGYMLLSYFLPGGGNGAYKLHAIVTDLDGHSVDLGTKTITVDNAHAVKPFGTIETPTEGGTASGTSFINWGWALTPQPNQISTGGSTINVYVDGVYVGHPHYNVYRSDIASLFPGYANSNGAIGYFYLDTTAYSNGIHTIQWTVSDNHGNTDGIGSRYFVVQN
ncbi:MAG: M20/M25/M40 family metallo-hydrolase [Candidatus Omnitrophota bacterium]